MAKHELKKLPEYLESVVYGSKMFEILKNARDFSVGDTILLNELDGVKTMGLWMERVITFADYEQREGYIVMRIARP